MLHTRRASHTSQHFGPQPTGGIPLRKVLWHADQAEGVGGLDSELAIKVSDYLPKLASVQLIPGVGEWILLLQDDVLPTGSFSVDSIYDKVMWLFAGALNAQT